MARTYIVGGDTWKPMVSWLDAVLVPVPAEKVDERGVHDYIVDSFTEEIGCLVLHADADMQFCMGMALHVRLTPELPGESYLCPIVFVTELPHENFLKQGTYSQIFLTENVSFCTAYELPRSIPLYTKMLKESYRSDFLDRIFIPRPEGNNHSLANQWGSSRMYKLVSGKDITPKEYRDFNNVQKDLYYKYVMGRISSRGGVSGADCSAPVRGASMKRVLLIDDEADKGWAKTVEQLLPTSFFDVGRDVVSERVHSYEELSEESRKKIESGAYDLFLLDLRMGGGSEDKVMDPSEFSGYRILKRIKELNPGNQVIMLTASNKAWNLKAVLDPVRGASGYFVKESPEYEFSDVFSAANINSFKKDIEMCFDRRFLRDFDVFRRSVCRTDEFHEELRFQLDMAFDMAAQSCDGHSFRYAYLAIAQVAEVITSTLTCEIATPSKQRELWLCEPDGRTVAPCLKQYTKGITVNLDRRRHNRETMVTSLDHVSFSQKERMAALWLQKWGRQDNGFIYLYAQLVQMRNAFIHKDGRARFDRSDPVSEKRLLAHQDMTDSSLVFSAPVIRPLLLEAARSGFLYNDTKTGHLILNGDMIRTSIGFRLYLEVLVMIMNNIKQ